MIITANGRRQSPEGKKKKSAANSLCNFHFLAFIVKIAEQVLVVLTLLLCQH